MVPKSLVMYLLSVSSLLLWSTTLASIEIMQEFFPQLDGDLTKVTWAHAVNTRQLLNDTLKGDILMIEADVIIARHSRDLSAPPMAMMGHPPATESDLSLKEFLETVSKSDPNDPRDLKGVKLDFKSVEVFNASEPVLEEYIYKTTQSIDFVPLWLNADIIPGPINSKVKPVDADYFLSTVNEKFPNAVISVGWTTEMSDKNSVGGYTVSQINNMTSALVRNRILQPVTFPVRAGLAAQSREPLVSLIETSVPGTSLTIWMSSETDPVSIPKLRCLIKTIGKRRTYLDVPDSIRTQLDLASIDNATCLPETQPENKSHAPMPSTSLALLLVALFVSALTFS